MKLSMLLPPSQVPPGGDWERFEDVGEEDYPRVVKVLVRVRDVEQVVPGSFQSAVALQGPYGNVGSPGVTYTLLGGLQVTHELTDIIAVELAP